MLQSRGERVKYARKKVASTGYRTHNHQVMSQTRSPLSQPGGLPFISQYISSKGKKITLSNLKEEAEENSMFHENDGMFSKRIENTLGIGEITRHEQFLLFPHCVQRFCPDST